MKVLVNNLAIEYTDEGRGPVMLLLHGWKDSLHTFDILFPGLSTSFRVIRLDLPGFGGSEMSKEPWGTGEYVQFVKAFIDKIGISVNVLVGHSFGGRIVVKGVGIGSLQPRKAVLIGSAGLVKQVATRNQLFKIIAKVGKIALFLFPSGVKEELRQKLYRKVGSGDYISAGALKETFLKITGEDLSLVAQKINVPTLLIWGEKDTETPLSDGKRFQGLIFDSTLKVIKGAGHFVHQERAEDVAALINKFAS